MRLSEFAEKRIINIATGELLGSAGDCDLLIDGDDGRIMELQLEEAGGLFSRGEKHIVNIPWDAVRKVGPQIIVVDMP